MRTLFLSWKNREEKLPLWVTSLILSLAGHIILFSFFSFFNGEGFKKKRQMKFIDVELMQLPLKPPEVKVESGKPVKKSAVLPPKKKKTTVKKKKATVTSKKRKANSGKKSPSPSVAKKKTSVKKTRTKVVKPGDILESARAKLHRDVEKQKDETIEERLKKMAEEVESESRRQAATAKEPKAASGIGSADAFESYMNNIRVLIRQNWAFTKNLAKKEENLVADVQFTVLPSGQITGEVWFEKRSGNSRYDQSAYNAIMKSNPFPPFPPGLHLKTLPVTINFNLEDLM